jgi:5-methylcytosine-specific restriction endonuclease McrA
VDHIKSINKEDPYNTEFGKYGEALNQTNLQALCHECHNSKSGKTKNKVK